MHPYFSWRDNLYNKIIAFESTFNKKKVVAKRCPLPLQIPSISIHTSMSELESSTQSHTDKTNYAGRTIYQLSPLMIMLSRPGAAPPPAASITHTSPGTSSAPARATRTSWPACWPRAACPCHVCRVCWWQTRVAACARYCDRGGAACHRAPRPARAR